MGVAITSRQALKAHEESGKAGIQRNITILSNFIKNNPNLPFVKARKLLHGVGVNDADYITTKNIDGKKVSCPYYSKWRSMIERCYSEKFHLKRPTYRGCSVSKEWQVFSNFKNWMEHQRWQGKELDKDILLIGNKVYSKETCVFVSRELNALLCTSSAIRGEYLIGVGWHKHSNKFRAVIKIHGKNKHIGLFDTVDEASNAYKKEKAKYLTYFALIQVDKRVKDGLLRHVEALRMVN